MGLNIDIYGKKDFFYKKVKNQMTGILTWAIFLKLPGTGSIKTPACTLIFEEVYKLIIALFTRQICRISLKFDWEDCASIFGKKSQHV